MNIKNEYDEAKYFAKKFGLPRYCAYCGKQLEKAYCTQPYKYTFKAYNSFPDSPKRFDSVLVTVQADNIQQANHLVKSMIDRTAYELIEINSKI